MSRHPLTAVEVADPVAVSVDEAARMSGLSRAYLYQHIATGALPSLTVGRRRLLMLDELTGWLRGHRDGGDLDAAS